MRQMWACATPFCHGLLSQISPHEGKHPLETFLANSYRVALSGKMHTIDSPWIIDKTLTVLQLGLRTKACRLD